MSQAHTAGGLPKAVIPFLMAHISYKCFVICIVKPIPICEVDWWSCFWWPALFRGSVNNGLGQPDINQSCCPRKENILNDWTRISRPVFVVVVL